MERMRAWARSEERIFMCSMPSLSRSPGYRVLPVTLPHASTRGMLCPSVLAAMSGLLLALESCGSLTYQVDFLGDDAPQDGNRCGIGRIHPPVGQAAGAQVLALAQRLVRSVVQDADIELGGMERHNFIVGVAFWPYQLVHGGEV